MKKYFKYSITIVNSIFNKNFKIRFRCCRNCDKKTLFLTTGDNPTDNRCLFCRSTEVSIFLVYRLKQLKLHCDSKVYELSYHGAVFNYLKINFQNFYCSEYISHEGLGQYFDGVRNEDVQRLTFSSNSLDMITSTEVFEHVPDYLIAFSEVYRVLNPGGIFVFTVPLFEQAETKQIAVLSKSGMIDWISEPEYHDSRVTGPGTVPVFWHHSRIQIQLDLIKSGFQFAEVFEDKNGISLRPAKVVIARKACPEADSCGSSLFPVGAGVL